MEVGAYYNRLCFWFPKSVVGRNAVWVIVDRLTKSAYFLPIRTTWSLNKLALLYVKEIVRMHGVPVTTVSNRDTRFTSQFWKALQKAIWT